MVRPETTGGPGGDDDLGAVLAGLDATEAAELEELGQAVGAALRDPVEPGLDAAAVDAIWRRVEPELG